MAATVSSPWGKPGAWALDAEEHEAELLQQPPQALASFAAAATEEEFPSLAAAKQPKTKKKKNQTLSLAEFSTYGSSKTTSLEPKGLTHEELLSLPTAPRQRSAEELDGRSRLGGGFKSYGLGNRSGDDSSNSRWGGGGSSRVSNNREFAPSRADETDDWSKTKKSTVGSGFERRERGGSFFESHSKADESDNWVVNKKPEPPRFGASNGGSERRGSFDSLSKERHVSNNSVGADSDNWGRKKDEDGDGSRGRPRLVLQPRTIPVENGDGGVIAKPKGASPFGDARPREEVLAEKGLDRKEIDGKLESMKINGVEEKEMEKGRRGDAGSFGRWSFGSFGSDRGPERSWRKPESVDASSRPQSADSTENGHAEEKSVAADNGHSDGN